MRTGGARAGTSAGIVVCAAAFVLVGWALADARGRGTAEGQDPARVEWLVARESADLEAQVNAYLLTVPADCLIGVEYEIETSRAESLGDHNAMVVRRC